MSAALCRDQTELGSAVQRTDPPHKLLERNCTIDTVTLSPNYGTVNSILPGNEDVMVSLDTASGPAFNS